MEPANIDWKKIQSIYIEDELYEHINAPKFVDFTSPDNPPVDDEAWFCKPDCRHPKTAEDFLRSSPFPNSQTKKLKSAHVLEPLRLVDRSCRDNNYLKRRAHISPLSSNGVKRDFHEDCSENQNPNQSSTPPPSNYQNKTLKAAFKSSSEKKKKTPLLLSHFSSDLSSRENRKPQLRSTLSARNLFGGRDIMNQITEFCNELKKLATRTKEKEDLEKLDSKKIVEDLEKLDLNEIDEEKEKKPLLAEEKEKKPLLAEEKENCGAVNSNVKEKQRKLKRNKNTENIGITVDLNKVVGHGGENSSMQVRTNPPSPQCFSAPRGPLRPVKATCTTPLKPSKSMLTERGILQEVEPNNNRLAAVTNESGSEENDDKVISSSNKSTSAVTGTTTEEARSLDLFWFFKPCTNFST